MWEKFLEDYNLINKIHILNLNIYNLFIYMDLITEDKVIFHQPLPLVIGFLSSFFPAPLNVN